MIFTGIWNCKMKAIIDKLNLNMKEAEFDKLVVYTLRVELLNGKVFLWERSDSAKIIESYL